MSKLKFKPEDFDHIEWCLRNMGQPQGAARDAQARFEKWLSEQPVVYGGKRIYNKWGFGERECRANVDSDTHTARLVCIEELPKKECEHEPITKVINDYSILRPQTVIEEKCKHCGIKLKAEWSPA